MLLLSELARSVFLDRTEAELTAVDVAVATYLVLGNARVLRSALKAAVGYDDLRRSAIDNLIGQIRYRADAKRIWKAVYDVLVGGVDEQEASTRYDVAVDDVRFVQRCLSREGRDRFVSTTRADEVVPNRPDMDEFVKPLQLHVAQLARRLAFIVKYDAGVSTEDLQQDMLLRAFRSAYDYENLDGSKDGVPHVLNMARQSASSGSADLINYHTHESRARIYSPVFCQGCGMSAPLNLRQGRKKKCEKCGSDKFIASADHPYETTTTNWNDDYVSHKDKEMPRLDVLSDIDLAIDLTAALDDTTLRYLRILMRESPEFDTWLADRNLGDAESLSDRRTRLLGADFLGASVEQLDAALRRAFQNAKTGTRPRMRP